MQRRLCALMLVASGLLGCHAEGIRPADLSADDFLALARRPFLQTAWGRFEGIIQHRGPEQHFSQAIRMGLMLRQDFMRAQIILDGERVYNVVQVYYESGLPNVTLEVPVAEDSEMLSSIGLRPDDVTFSFLYWDLVRELERQSIRGRDCRQMELRNPRDGRRVIAWFSAEFLFPLKLLDFADADQVEPTRTVEFTDFKKHGELWYVKTMILRGADWKTQVKFKDGDMALTEEKAPPPDLFMGSTGEGTEEED